MVIMCPQCFELYTELWPVPCYKCQAKTIETAVELATLVKLLIERGFKIASSSCYTVKSEKGVGKTTHMMIKFGEKYPPELFPELPSPWQVTTYHPVIDKEVKEYEWTGLACVCEHPPGEDTEDIINFEKRVAGYDMETWVETHLDPEACQTMLTFLRGY